MSTGSDYQKGSAIDAKTLVLQAVDLVQLIGQSVALKKRGKSFIGLCPFHQEKTPSFHVHPDRGYFYCFGCKAAGNAIDFVMRRDRLEFVDALRHLAEQYQIELPRFGSTLQSGGLRQTLLEAHSIATTYFEKNLQHPQVGQKAREYLISRGFNEDTIRRFRLGLATSAFDGLMKSPLMQKFGPDVLIRAGLLRTSESGKVYDTFRDRLIFPIRDEAGRVIAFGGRVLPGSDHPAKYLNSPETPLFSKSRVAYGLDLARPRILETRTVAIVEGYTDVVMAHQFGATNVVSVLGTALTEQHIALLRRFADRIVLLFDGDNAGDLAVERALEVFLTQPIEIGIATLPANIDPDEYLLKQGLPAFDRLIDRADDALTFQWKKLFQRLSETENDLTARSRLIDDYLQRLASARSGGPVDPIRWGSIIARVSKLTNIPVEELNRKFRVRKSPVRSSKLNTPSAGSTKSHPSLPPIPPARRQAERWILGGLLHLPRAWVHVQQVLDSKEFMSEELKPLADWYWDYQRHEGEISLEELIHQLEDPGLKSLVIELASEVETMNNLPQRLEEAVHFIQKEREISSREKQVLELKRNKELEAVQGDEVLRALTAAKKVVR